MDNQQMQGFSLNAMNILRPTTLGCYASNGQQIVARPSVHFAPDIDLNTSPSVNTDRSPPAPVQFEDQPSWLDDLLDEPDSPVNNKPVHRRSHSDSAAYLDTDSRGPKEGSFYPSMAPVPTFEFQNSGYYKALLLQSSAYLKPTPPGFDGVVSTMSGLTLSQPEQNKALPIAQGLQNQEDDAKRAKQHNARRSRVRKVQYIAELERSIQVLCAQGSLVSAELEFLNHQNLILSMENTALKQRLESLAQVQVIKSLEQDVLEKEMARLQYLYHQQNICLQQQQQQLIPNHVMHRRVKSCNDFEPQFVNLSLRPNETGPTPNNDRFQDPKHRV